MAKLLITFGCSWTYGVGAGYQPGMTDETYRVVATDQKLSLQYSFRNLLCQEFNLEHKNFSKGGSSNQKQFRFAKEYFGSDEFKQDQATYEKILVLHAITSTARNEFFCLEKKQLISVRYNDEEQGPLAQFMAKHSYDHANELRQLVTEMKFWNVFYKAHGIKNVWLDTFNHHEYNHKFPNLIGADYPHRDLMSQLCIRNGINEIDDKYHKSSWVIDSDRADFLLKKEILNPISLHPTRDGHIQIFEIIKKYFIENDILS